MAKSILDLVDPPAVKSTSARLLARLYLGAADEYIDIWNWQEFRSKIAPQLARRGWNQKVEWQNTAIPAVPPEQVPDRPPGYFLLGIVQEVAWPKSRPKHTISTFQKPRPETENPGPKDADVQVRRLLEEYSKTLDFSCFDEKDYLDLYDRVAPLVPEFGLFKKQLYKDIGYTSEISDNFTYTSFTIVRSDFKDAVSSLEPYNHLFFPYEIRCDDGRIINDYWIFFSLGKVDAVDPYASCFIKKFSEVGFDHFIDYVPWTETEAARNRVVVRKDAVDGRHYVVDKHFGPGRPIISLELAQKLENILWNNQRAVPIIVREK